MVSCEGLGRGGVQAVMMSFVRNLKESFTFDILLFTNDVRYYDAEFLTYGGKIIRIPHYSGRLWLRKRIDYYIRGASLFFKVKKALKKNGPYQAIHCNNSYEAALCLMAAKNAGIPVRICHSHTACTSSNFLAKILNGIYAWLINRTSTHKIGCSLDACNALYGDKEHYNVLNNSYDDAIFDPAKYNNCSNSKFIITQVGRFDDNKNQFFSLEVISSLIKKKKDVLLKLIGFGNEEYINCLKQKAIELKVEENILFVDGNSANIPVELSQSSAFLFPSKKEGFGITLIEAQAMGLTCFVSDSVPKTTNVGGCIYLSLDDGPEKWASEILKTPCQRKKYDCTQFKTSEVVKQIALLYGGEK